MKLPGAADQVEIPITAAPDRGEASMIDLYSWATPNGHKIHIMLEECGLSYRAHPVDIGKGEQFKAIRN
jgi:hypothetical protein